MKKIVLTIMTMMAIIIANPYLDKTTTGSYIKAFSDEGGVGLVTIEDGMVVLVASLNVGYNEHGSRPVILSYGNDQVFMCEATYVSTTSDGSRIYDLNNDFNIISILKKNTSVDVVILNSEHGGDDGLWGQTIPLMGYTKLFNTIDK